MDETEVPDDWSKDWYNDETIWNSLSKDIQRRWSPLKPMMARLVRFGYRIISFDPGVQFEIDGQRAQMNGPAWVVFDKALAEIERSRPNLNKGT